MIELPPLPYETDALEPYLSKKVLELHYGKHHKTYVENVNKLVKGTVHEGKTVEQIIEKTTSGPIYNNAAQVYNHTFLWKSMTPDHKQLDPDSKIGKAIVNSFKSEDEFKKQYKEAATKLFGSGYVWLVTTKSNPSKVEIVTKKDADCPYGQGETVPLLCIDMWEHGYYTQYESRKGEYVDGFLKLINWDFVNENLESA